MGDSQGGTRLERFSHLIAGLVPDAITASVVLTLLAQMQTAQAAVKDALMQALDIQVVQ